MNVQIIKHIDAKDELSKFEGDYITITSYGQQLASWGKTETSGLLLSASTKRKMHKFNLLQVDELNEFTSKSYQHQYFIIDNSTHKLFVENDDCSFTQDKVHNLTK